MGACSSSAKIWGWGVTRRTHLNGSTIPTQGPTPDTKLAAMGLNGLPSSVRPWFVEASPTVEKAVSCYKSGPTHSLVAKFLQHSVVTCSTWISCCRGRTLQTGCVRTFDAWCRVAQSASELLQLCELSRRKNLAWWAVTRRTLKNHKTVKSGGWALARVWALARDNTVYIVNLTFSDFHATC